jgi:post-segregation antitoxin (ccd killing protein)
LPTHKNSVDKTNVTIRINSEILQQAKDLGLNISKVTENALLLSIKALKPVFLNECSFAKENSVEPRAGFEPATSALPRQCPTS